jgi:hypothetical protein
VAVCAAAALACSAHGWLTLAAAGPVRFDADTRAAGIPFVVNNGHILLRARLADRDSATFVLDSGASTCVLDDGAARRFALKVERGGHALGAGGFVDAGRVNGVSLGLPGLTLPRLTMVTLSLAGVSANSGRPIDGVLGRPLFDSCAVRLDYEHDRMDVIDARGWDYSGDGAVLPLTFESGLAYVTAKVTLAGGASIEGRFVLDIGAATALALGPDVVTREHALASAGHTITITTGGIGGPSEHDLGRAARLELGRFTLDSVLTIYRRPGPGAISAPGTLGNIGAQILSRFTVTFDFPHRRVILEPNARIAERFAYDMGGMGLRARGAAYDTLEVAWLVPNGPAAEAGLQAGDVIHTVDGVPAGSLGLEGLRERLRHPGAVVLGVPGPAGHRDVRLVTRPLI